jgi:hypothetical protein
VEAGRVEGGEAESERKRDEGRQGRGGALCCVACNFGLVPACRLCAWLPPPGPDPDRLGSPV